MPKIKKDNFGLYVKSGGYIARPRHDSYYTPGMPQSFTGVSSPDSTQFKEGDDVKARHRGGSVSHIVKNDTIEEKWESRSGEGMKYDYAEKMCREKYGTDWQLYFDDYVKATELWDKHPPFVSLLFDRKQFEKELEQYIQVNYYDRINEKRAKNSLTTASDSGILIKVENIK